MLISRPVCAKNAVITIYEKLQASLRGPLRNSQRVRTCDRVIYQLRYVSHASIFHSGRTYLFCIYSQKCEKVFVALCQ